jgi:hypothetical protein
MLCGHQAAAYHHLFDLHSLNHVFNEDRLGSHLLRSQFMWSWVTLPHSSWLN